MDSNESSRHPNPAFEKIVCRIFLIRGMRVILDSDLAQFYGVSTARLNQQVQRNRDRFPQDFTFQLTFEEQSALMLQFATSKKRRGGRHKLAFVFTQEGIGMLSGVLRSSRAVQAHIAIMRAFVRLREMAASDQALGRRLEALESEVASHRTHIMSILEAISEAPDIGEGPARRIGFSPG